MLLSWILNNYEAKVPDKQTAFLHKKLKEELFLSIPDGYKEFQEENGDQINWEYLKLNKLIYGLVQAAQAWWKWFVKVLTKHLNFEQYANDSCLLRRKDANGIV